MLWWLKNKGKITFCLVILILTGFLIVPKIMDAQHNDYPKIANYFLKWGITDSDINELAKWDIVILSPQALEQNPQVITKLRQQNPNIKILAYVLTQEINISQDILNKTSYWRKIYDKVEQNNWWLKNANGGHVSFWEGTWMINAANTAPKTNGQNWSDYLPELVNAQFLQNGPWDGVFYDNVWGTISWLNQPIDTDANGSADSAKTMDTNWQNGLNNILTKTKNLAPDKLIVINTNTNLYNQNANGRMQENFPPFYEGNWPGSMQNYLNDNLGYQPKYFIINNNSENTGIKDNYQDFRYGLTSTLLGDGYYSYDYGDKAHESLWWYDEYNFYLGRSVTEIKNLLEPNSREIKPGVWERDFQNGLVLVNSTNTEQKISFNEEFEKLKGTQDKTTNSGAIVRSVTLQPQDGIILLRRVDEITGTAYFNGSFVRVFNRTGDTVRNGFFLYNKNFKGGNIINKTDINNDGQLETVVADLSKITIYNSANQVITSFYPYGTAYNKGINFDINDFENDGYSEIVTGTMKGYEPLVKVFNYKGEEQGKGFDAYAKTYQGGVTVAVCNTTGKGSKEIVTGTGYLGGPQVRIFDKNGKVLSGGFFAYAKTFRGGVNVTCGDINGDGKEEIVTGAGYGGTAHIRMFNSKFEALGKGFWAFEQTSRTGVRVFVNDLDGDGIEEILAASPETFTTALQKTN
jgi:hypothetical protein